MLGSYNGFSGEQRELVSQIIKELKAGKQLVQGTCCNRCGQDQGIIHDHLEDYSLPVTQEKIEHLCWRCHMMWHSRFRAPKAAEKYFAAVKEGKRFAPVFKHNFNILKEHGV